MRTVTAEEAVASIGDGDTVFVHGGAATPAALLKSLAERAPKLSGVSTVGLHLVIRRLRKMVAVNSAIEIDLSGQVVADSIGRRLYSGVGGQMDFIRGAALAEEGRAIIALPSTAAGGAASRIVASLREGAGVVTTRAHVRAHSDRAPGLPR